MTIFRIYQEKLVIFYPSILSLFIDRVAKINFE